MNPKTFPTIPSKTCGLATSVLAPILGIVSLLYAVKSACT